MKLRSTKLLSIVLGTLSCASVYAELNPADNIDYTLTENGDGTYNSKVVIGDGVDTAYAGGVYVEQTDGSFCNTELRDVTIDMTGGKVTDFLSAGNFRANPVDGKVQMDITGGSIGTLVGGNHMNTHLNSSYIDSASIESITINVGGNAIVGTLRGGSIVGVDGGYPDENYFQKYTTTGDININITDNATITTIYGAAGPDLVNGSVNVNMEGGTVTTLYANNGGSISEDANINVKDATVTNLYDVVEGSVKGDVTTTVTNGKVNLLLTSYGGTIENNATTILKESDINFLYGVYGGTIEKDSSISIDGGTLKFAYGVINGTVGNNSSIIVKGGNVDYLYGVYGGLVKKDSAITIHDGTYINIIGIMNGIVMGDSTITVNGGNMTEINGTYGGVVTGNVAVTVNDGTVTGTTTGSRVGTVKGNVDVTINGGNLSNVYAANAGSVTGNTAVHLNGGQVSGSVYGGDAELIGGTRTLYVGTAKQAHNATVGNVYGFDKIVVARGASLNVQNTNWNVFDTKEHTYTLSSANLHTASVVANGYAFLWDADVITINLIAGEKLKSGRYVLIDAGKATLMTDNWKKEKVIVNSKGLQVSFDDLVWENNRLVFTIRSTDVESAIVSNWGIFKSSQAFVNSLWGNRSNSVVISDSKKAGRTTEPTAHTIAWGNVYGQSSRISGIGADYSIFGGAIGAERHYPGKRMLGVALGYDWGTVSPFNSDKVNQETAHFALYGRAAEKKLGQKDHLLVDWSATVGNTASDSDAIQGKWEQNSMQLDARVSYRHQLNERMHGSVFAGLQYFAAEDDTVGTTTFSSMQNLRTEVGVGLFWQASSKASIYGEAAIYNDAMRHNPSVTIGGVRFSGTNPGRLGGSLSVGAIYELNNKWNLHGNYSFDMADDNKGHNVNIGVSYEF